jgi:hypothetical protein
MTKSARLLAKSVPPGWSRIFDVSQILRPSNDSTFTSIKIVQSAGRGYGGQSCFSGCPNQELGSPFLFKGPIIRASSYFGMDGHSYS